MLLRCRENVIVPTQLVVVVKLNFSKVLVFVRLTSLHQEFQNIGSKKRRSPAEVEF